MTSTEIRTGAVGGLALERSEAPWRRGIRSLLKKRVAVVSLIAIIVIYGAGAYTFLDAFGVPTGLQDPNKTNLTVRRPIQEGETLGAFAARQDVSLARIAELNSAVGEEFGALAPDTTIPAGTQLVLRPDAALQGPLRGPLVRDGPHRPRHVQPCPILCQSGDRPHGDHLRAGQHLPRSRARPAVGVRRGLGRSGHHARG